MSQAQAIQQIKESQKKRYEESIGQYLKLSTEELGKITFKYGKHKDKSFDDVLINENDYACWASSQKFTEQNPSLFLFKEYLKRLIK